MVKKKVLSNKSVQLYVREALWRDVKVLAERSGLSISAVAGMAFSEGLPKVRESLLKLKPSKE